MKKYLMMWTVVLSVFLGAAFAESKPLSLGFMPYIAPSHLLDKYTPLAAYLSGKLGRKVEIVIAKNYGEHLENVGNDKVDIAFLGGSPYVVVGDQYGKKPLLARYEFNNKPTFRSVVFVSKNNPIRSISELKAKRIAFGSKKSTLSTQVPAYMIEEGGVSLSELKKVTFMTNHENVVLGVLVGEYEAGAVAEEIFIEKKYMGIKALAYSPDLSTHVFVTRSNMESQMQEEIKKALLDLKNQPEGAQILTNISINLTGFVKVQDSDYDLHRKILNNILPKLDPL